MRLYDEDRQLDESDWSPGLQNRLIDWAINFVTAIRWKIASWRHRIKR